MKIVNGFTTNIHDFQNQLNKLHAFSVIADYPPDDTIERFRLSYKKCYVTQNINPDDRKQCLLIFSSNHDSLLTTPKSNLDKY